MNKVKCLCKVNGVEYFIHREGKVFKKEKGITEEIKPLKSCDLYVNIGKKRYFIKHLVAKAFLKGYQEGYHIFFKNKNHNDCSVENLYAMSAREHGKYFGKFLSGKNKPIKIIVNGKTKEYFSMRECCRDLGIALKTLQDRLKGHNNMLKNVYVELL